MSQSSAIRSVQEIQHENGWVTVVVTTLQGNVGTAEYFHSAQREGAIRDATEMAISKDLK